MFLDYIPGLTKAAAMDDFLLTRQQILDLLKGNLVATQDRMKLQADKHRQERSFEVGDLVFLRLQPFKQHSLHWSKMRKLAPKFFGPFQILQKVGSVAYKLDLPSTSGVHPVFHVSCLKANIGQFMTPIPTLPPVDAHSHITPEPKVVLQQRQCQIIRYKDATEVLVH